MSKLTSNELRKKYIGFFKAWGHAVIPSAPLVPENDSTTLFTSSGMQPLVPYLLGERHPEGTRLVDSQPSVRMDDIDEVGDNRHMTFFEMLGNWSLGDYFKKEQLRWFWKFLTKEVGLEPEKLYVSVFAGSPRHNIPKDEESIKIWKEIYKDAGILAKDVELLTEEKGAELGMQGGRIFAYDAKKNWWARVLNPDEMPAGEPGGPDSEVFYEFTSVKHDPAFGKHCHPNCDCGRFLEIGNSVFMEYVKQENGSFKSLPAKNVDFGGGFERILAASYDDPDVFKTDLFWPVIEVLEELTGLKYEDQLPRFQPEQPPRLFEVEPRRIRESFRVIADHMKASVIMASQGLEPGNKQQGYVLRRLLRRAAVKLRRISFSYQGEVRPARRSLGEGRWAHFDSIKQIVEAVIGVYEGVYLSEKKDLERINGVIGREFVKFERTLENGLKIIEKQDVKEIGGKTAFDLWQTYGFPFELTRELVEERGGVLDKSEFDLEFIKHQEKSRTASESVFRGGLADHSENVIKYHTATHLLHAALRKVLGEQVRQRGSNITGGRLRFDFSYGEKVGEKELEEVEKLVNEQIEADLPVSFETMTYDQAIKQGALAFYGEKYPKKVKVYTVGPKREVQGQSPEPADGSPEPASVFSREICGGPHVEHTGVIGKIDIFKETSAGAGVRRIYTRMVE